jgi:hypothetical protein
MNVAFSQSPVTDEEIDNEIVVGMTLRQKEGVKKIARKLYRDGRISLAMASWAMYRAGYADEAVAAWLSPIGDV